MVITLVGEVLAESRQSQVPRNVVVADAPVQQAVCRLFHGVLRGIGEAGVVVPVDPHLQFVTVTDRNRLRQDDAAAVLRRADDIVAGEVEVIGEQPRALAVAGAVLVVGIDRLEIAQVGADDEPRIQLRHGYVGGVELGSADAALPGVFERNGTTGQQGHEARLQVVDRDLEDGRIEAQAAIHPLGLHTQFVLRHFLRLHVVRRFIDVDDVVGRALESLGPGGVQHLVLAQEGQRRLGREVRSGLRLQGEAQQPDGVVAARCQHAGLRLDQETFFLLIAAAERHIEPIGRVQGRLGKDGCTLGSQHAGAHYRNARFAQWRGVQSQIAEERIDRTHQCRRQP